MGEGWWVDKQAIRQNLYGKEILLERERSRGVVWGEEEREREKEKEERDRKSPVCPFRGTARKIEPK